ALVVGPQGSLLELRVPLPQAEPVDDHRTLPAGVHDHWGADLALGATLQLYAHADGPAALEQHLQHARPLVDLDAVPAGVVKEHLVEFATDDLPSLRRLVRL